MHSGESQAFVAVERLQEAALTTLLLLVTLGSPYCPLLA
jgi:hypothetical protein